MDKNRKEIAYARRRREKQIKECFRKDFLCFQKERSMAWLGFSERPCCSSWSGLWIQRPINAGTVIVSALVAANKSGLVHLKNMAKIQYSWLPFSNLFCTVDLGIIIRIWQLPVYPFLTIFRALVLEV